MKHRYARAPAPTFRLIPSRFPPIGLFDTVATASDLHAVIELAGWTNDRLVADRIARLDQADRVYGRPNASVIMASFLHVAPGGMRFNGPALGAWYAAASMTTAVVEVAHHLRREAVATGATRASRQYRAYTATLRGDYLDIRGEQKARPDLYASDSYSGGQAFGEGLRAGGSDGLLFDSVRHVSGVNAVSFRPRNVLDVLQTDHFEIRVEAATPLIQARKLVA